MVELADSYGGSIRASVSFFAPYQQGRGIPGLSQRVFAYEGAVCLPLKDQAPHANPVKGTTVEEEEHPTTKAFVSSLLEIGNGNPLLTWVNCGLCVDERGAGSVVDGVKRGSPADFLKMAQESTNTLVIPTK